MKRARYLILAGADSQHSFYLDLANNPCEQRILVLQGGPKKCTTFTKCRLHLLANPTTHYKSGSFFLVHPVYILEIQQPNLQCHGKSQNRKSRARAE